jgi:hypothetical protein
MQRNKLQSHPEAVKCLADAVAEGLGVWRQGICYVGQFEVTMSVDEHFEGVSSLVLPAEQSERGRSVAVQPQSPWLLGQNTRPPTQRLAVSAHLKVNEADTNGAAVPHWIQRVQRASDLKAFRRIG